MRKWFVSVLAALMVILSYPMEGQANTVYQPAPPAVSLPTGTNIDALTTSRNDAPWWVQYHMTTPQQAAIGYKGGEASQMVYALSVAPSNPQHLLMGTDTSGIWKSEDGGTQWSSSNAGFGLMGTVDIAFDPDDENIAYAAASPNTASTPMLESNLAGIWKSVDGGANWNQVLKTSFYRKPSNKLIRFGELTENGSRAIYVASHSKGIFKSTDGGVEWDNLGLVGETIYDLFVDTVNGKLVAATETNGIKVSADDGATWAAANTGFAGLKAFSVTVDPADANHWFAIANGNVYHSTNQGGTWINLNVPRSDVGSNGIFTKLQFGVPDAMGHSRLYLSISNTQDSLRYSTDLGATWNKPVVHNETAFLKDNWGWFSEAFAVDPSDPNGLWVPLDNEIYTSRDGAVNLYPSSSGFSGMRASGFLFDATNNNNIYISSIDRGLVRTAVYGTESYPLVNYLMEDRYGPRYAGEKTVLAIARDPQDSQHLWINIGNWGSTTILSESHDGGFNFTPVTGTETSGARLIAYHPQNHSIIYAGRKKSVDGGLTWSTLNKNVTGVSPINGNVVWSMSDGQISKSTDAGLNWTTLVTTISGIQNTQPDLFDVDRLWIGSFANGMYRLDGSVLTPINSSNGLVRSLGGSLPIFDIAQDPGNPLHLVAGGTDNQSLTPTAGLFETLDGGQTWRVVEGMPGTRDIWKVAFHPNLPRVYVGTSSGTWVYEYDKYVDRKLLSDTFQSGSASGWNPQSGSWSVASDSTHVIGIGNTEGEVKTGNSTWDNYAVQAKIKMTSQNFGSGPGLTFRNQDSNNMYQFQLNISTNNLRLMKKQGGVWSELASVPQSLNFNTWYTAKVSVNGTTITCYLDGKEKITFPDSTFDKGAIGLRSYNTASIFDDVLVTDLQGLPLFSDDFEDGNSVGWLTTLGVSWPVTIDNASLVYKEGSLTGESLTTAGNLAWNNYSFQSRVKLTGEGASSSGASLIFRYQDSDNMYALQLNKSTGQILLRKKLAGIWSTLGSVSQTFNLNQWYMAKIFVNGGSITAYLDDEEKIQLTDSSLDNGKVGYHTTDASAWFDDASVTLYVRVNGVTLSASDVVLNTTTHNVVHVNAAVIPVHAVNKRILWTSDHPTVATVDQTGNIRAVSAGTATIVATTAEGGYQAAVTVTVSASSP